jgi:hypothetical protein
LRAREVVWIWKLCFHFKNRNLLPQTIVLAPSGGHEVFRRTF